jgi:chromosomal replication initiation ATPase DnaA
MPVAAERSVQERALEALRRNGNPFRNYFARNPDDEICSRYHVAELYAREREQLLGVVDLYRYDPTTHSEVVPVLGNKGAGKTHLLHSIKHGQEGAWQLLVSAARDRWIMSVRN